jgi:hypothetical protein
MGGGTVQTPVSSLSTELVCLGGTPTLRSMKEVPLLPP